MHAVGSDNVISVKLASEEHIYFQSRKQRTFTNVRPFVRLLVTETPQQLEIIILYFTWGSDLKFEILHLQFNKQGRKM